MRRSCLLALLVAFSASADIVLDQQQPLIGTHRSQLGGDVEQKLAQTVTAGISGRLVEVHVPIECGTGEIILEIRRLTGEEPTGPVIAREIVRAGEFPRIGRDAEFHPIVLDPAPRFDAGQRFAISLRNKSGACNMWGGPDGDSYADGDGWFINNTPPTTEWTRLRDTPSTRYDWPFKTFVDDTPVPDRSSPPCHVSGFGFIPEIPNFLPVCRCLEDASLRETRCALFHPDFFLVRRIPWPLKPGATFKVKWTLMPLGPIKGVLEVTDDFGLESPLTFSVDQLPRGESITLEYQGTVSSKVVESTITFTRAGQKPDSGTMRTVLELEK